MPSHTAMALGLKFLRFMCSELVDSLRTLATHPPVPHRFKRRWTCGLLVTGNVRFPYESLLSSIYTGTITDSLRNFHGQPKQRMSWAALVHAHGAGCA